MDKNQKFKIWFIQYDDDGNEIGRGVSTKEYVNWGTANHVARKRYDDMENIKYVIAQRDPWQEYYKECFCDICGYKYKRPESPVFGTDWGCVISRLDRCVNDRIPRHDYRKVCMECFDKIDKFIDDMKGKKND